MTIDPNTIISVSEANQSFSRVTRIADKNGLAVIFKATPRNSNKDDGEYL